MKAIQFRVNEVFEIPTRGELITVGSTRNGDFVGTPRLRDDASGKLIHTLWVDHPMPRTRQTGETILVVDRADADRVQVGRIWTAE